MPPLRFRALLVRLLPIVVIAGCTGEATRASVPPPWTAFEGGDELVGAYDPSRLRWRGDTVDVWLRFQHDEPRPLPGGRAGTFSIVETQQAVHCARGTTSDIRMLLRDAAGDSLGGYTAPAPRWIPFAEHGLTQDVFEPLCAVLPAPAPSA
jgi:hypothetical protein